ncbi:MAG: hypothetical protein HYZ14_12320 [Bacteroidetes bacterium]|nr:hypothetical protein [Bacteroidota bacterium]
MIVLSLSCSFVSFSQDTTNATIDSLIMQLMTDTEDPAKVDVYNSLSLEYLQLDYTRSLEYSNLAYDLAKKLKYNEGLLKACMALAQLNLGYVMDFGAANRYYNEAYPLAQSLKDRKSEMLILRGFSYIQRSGKNLPMAQEYNKKAMEIAVELGDYAYQADLNAYMGGLYEESGDTAAAIDAYAEVLALERTHDFTATSNASMIAIARYYYLIDDPGQSLKYYRIALKKFERTDDNRWVAYTHSEMAHLYIYKKDLKRAEQHALKGLEIAEANKLLKETGDNYLALVSVYTAMDSLAKADEYTKAYDSLQKSLKPVEVATGATETEKEETATAPKAKMNGFLQVLLIMLPVFVIILIAGRPTKKKS